MPSFVLPVIVTLDISAFDPQRCIPLLTFVILAFSISREAPSPALIPSYSVLFTPEILTSTSLKAELPYIPIP
jgi:hypothetical protein